MLPITLPFKLSATDNTSLLCTLYVCTLISIPCEVDMCLNEGFKTMVETLGTQKEFPVHSVEVFQQKQFPMLKDKETFVKTNKCSLYIWGCFMTIGVPIKNVNHPSI